MSSRVVAPLAAVLLITACPGPLLPIDDGGILVDGGTDGGPLDGGGGGGGDGGTGDGGFVWPVPIAPITITPHESWKNRVQPPSDQFIVNKWDLPSWVKFTVLMRDPSKVYFQNSRTYAFHAPFAVERLNPFFGMTLQQFEQVSLNEAGQEAITGAVVLPSDWSINEVGIQLVRREPYAKEMVKHVYDLVVQSLDAKAGAQIFYMPTLEQAGATDRDRAWLEANGVKVSTADRWQNGAICYQPGWALGRLVQLAPSEISAAYADGRLTVNDVLLLATGVPAELPPVAGVVTLKASTPNSHVAILAGTLGVPFVFTPHERDATTLAALVGKQVVLRTSGQGSAGSCRLDVFEADAAMPQTVRDELLSLKAPSPINLMPKATRGAFSAPVDGLQPADVKYFGGKATNFGVLRRAIPNNSYQAVGLSFDLWDDAMSQPLSNGKTLKAEVAERLAAHTVWPPANLAALKTTLAGVRELIEKQATFSTAAQAGVRAALTGYDPLKRIRFRSSTNVEDAADFTGAGLYDSYSGCLADDDDADTVGPSLCDASEDNERGVFRAIRKVYASFYNDNAYLERLRHGVVETQVGMAVLVHYSVPDETEQANGVATFDISQSSFPTFTIVTQLGADSVTNPTGESTPEEVRGYISSGTPNYDLVRGSSRVPLSALVMEDADYKTLAQLMQQVATAYRALVPTGPLELDFEFKKIAPGKMFLKQVRQLPRPSTTPSVTPFLLNRVGEKRCVAQGEYSDVFAIHRAKMSFAPAMKNVRLSDTARALSLFSTLSVQLFDGDAYSSLSGNPTSFAGYLHAVTGNLVSDRFDFGTGGGARSVEVSVELPKLVAPAAVPIFTLSDFTPYVTSRWSTAQPTMDWMGPGTTTEETVALGSCTEDEVITPGHSAQTRAYTGPNGLKVDVAFYWPPFPSGPTAGYTAPLVKWTRTEIRGLTTDPLVLTTDLEQSYRPEHHNFSESFLFDPFRSSVTTPAQKAELMTKNVRWLVVSGDQMMPKFHAVGLDGVLRELK